METTITIKEIKINGEWANAITMDGSKVGIKLSGCPKLKAEIEKADQSSPFNLTGNLIAKGSNAMLWDIEEKKPQQGPGGKYNPKDQKSIIAQVSLKASVEFWGHKEMGATSMEDISIEKIIETAEAFNTWVLSKSSL